MSHLWALALNKTEGVTMKMSRQEKRAELRKVAKAAVKIRNGSATMRDITTANVGIQKLQKVGALPPSKKLPIHKRVGLFFRKLLGGQVGYIRS